MNNSSLEFLSRLDAADWFSRIGDNDVEGAHVVSTWRELVRISKKTRWEDFLMERSNDVRRQLSAASKERYFKWNQVIVDINSTTDPLVSSKVSQVKLDNNLPEMFEATIRWEIMFACMEYECLDICPTGFFVRNAEWYIQGHCPCGWLGEFPQGGWAVY